MMAAPAASTVKSTNAARRTRGGTAVTAGTVTAYDGHDDTCAPHTYTVGMGFVDAGGDHVHVIRNEGIVEALGKLDPVNEDAA